VAVPVAVFAAYWVVGLTDKLEGGVAAADALVAATSGTTSPATVVTLAIAAMRPKVFLVFMLSFRDGVAGCHLN
jgi:hypothetical protein